MSNTQQLSFRDRLFCFFNNLLFPGKLTEIADDIVAKCNAEIEDNNKEFDKKYSAFTSRVSSSFSDLNNYLETRHSTLRNKLCIAVPADGSMLYIGLLREHALAEIRYQQSATESCVSLYKTEYVIGDFISNTDKVITTEHVIPYSEKTLDFILFMSVGERVRLFHGLELQDMEFEYNKQEQIKDLLTKNGLYLYMDLKKACPDGSVTTSIAEFVENQQSNDISVFDAVKNSLLYDGIVGVGEVGVSHTSDETVTMDVKFDYGSEKSHGGFVYIDPNKVEAGEAVRDFANNLAIANVKSEVENTASVNFQSTPTTDAASNSQATE